MNGKMHASQMPMMSKFSIILFRALHKIDTMNTIYCNGTLRWDTDMHKLV